MVNLVNSWAKGIIVALIITIIIEMVLPEDKNKKYIKTIINIYILYVIIAPVYSKITNKKIDVAEAIRKYEIEEMSVPVIDNNKYIKEDYKLKIEKNIKEDVEKINFNVLKVKVYINEKEEDYGKIEKIELVISKKASNAIKKVESVKIQKEYQEDLKKGIGDGYRAKIYEVLNTNYGIEKENILIKEAGN